MRITLSVCALALLALGSGCGSGNHAPARGPVLVGKLEGGTFWKAPTSAPNNEGGEYEKGSRVEVYDQFVAVTTPNGLTHIHPHGHYSGLMIRRE